MTEASQPLRAWIARQRRWFRENPTRRHRMTEIPVAAVAALIAAQPPDVELIATAFSGGPPCKSLRLHNPQTQRSVRCAVARAAHPAHPAPHLKIAVVDLPGPVLRPYKRADAQQQAWAEEAMARTVIELARFSTGRKENLGDVIRRVLQGRNLFARD